MSSLFFFLDVEFRDFSIGLSDAGTAGLWLQGWSGALARPGEAWHGLVGLVRKRQKRPMAFHGSTSEVMLDTAVVEARVTALVPKSREPP